MLDPIADKLLVAACLLMLVADSTIHGWALWAAIVILCREILVSGLREFLAELKVGVPVSRVAKWKTTVQLVALGFLVAGPAGESVLPGTIAIGIVLLWVAAAPDALYRLGLSEDRHPPHDRRGLSRREARLFRLGARAGRQDGRGGRPAAGRRAPSPTSCGWLKARGEEYAYAFENEGVVRAAIDRVHVKPEAPSPARARSPSSRR